MVAGASEVEQTVVEQTEERVVEVAVERVGSWAAAAAERRVVVVPEAAHTVDCRVEVE